MTLTLLYNPTSVPPVQAKTECGFFRWSETKYGGKTIVQFTLKGVFKFRLAIFYNPLSYLSQHEGAGGMTILVWYVHM